MTPESSAVLVCASNGATIMSVRKQRLACMGDFPRCSCRGGAGSPSARHDNSGPVVLKLHPDCVQPSGSLKGQMGIRSASSGMREALDRRKTPLRIQLTVVGIHGAPALALIGVAALKEDRD